jgi:hypothetical protein
MTPGSLFAAAPRSNHGAEFGAAFLFSRDLKFMASKGRSRALRITMVLPMSCQMERP